MRDGLTLLDAELPVVPWEPLSCVRENGTTATGCVLDVQKPRQDGPMRGQGSVSGAAGKVGPGPGDLDPSTQPAAARAARRREGLLKGGLDFPYHARHLAQRPVSDFSGGRGAVWRQALGGSCGLSFMR